MTTVQLQKIEHSFDALKVLRGVDFRVESGEYLVLLGQSGGGKTTTLRVIAGLQQPESGAVILDDVDVTGLPPRRRDVAMVFQHDALYPHLTVERSIRFALKKHVSRSQVAQRTAEAARLTGIEPLLDRLPRELSGGQLRRAAIAKAIARQSGLLLLDEPLASLDGQARESLQSDLLRWHRSLGGTTLHVTHDGQEAMRMADRIGVLDQGRIVQLDEPQTIYHRPATLAVARTVGTPSIQCFAADLETSPSESPHYVLRGKRGTYRSDTTNDALPASITLAVRPECLKLRPGENFDVSPFELSIHGLLQHRASLGRDSLMTVTAGDQSLTVLAPIGDETTIHVGDAVWVCADSRDIHVFDGESEQRVTPR